MKESDTLTGASGIMVGIVTRLKKYISYLCARGLREVDTIALISQRGR